MSECVHSPGCVQGRVWVFREYVRVPGLVHAVSTHLPGPGCGSVHAGATPCVGVLKYMGVLGPVCAHVFVHVPGLCACPCV